MSSRTTASGLIVRGVLLGALLVVLYMKDMSDIPSVPASFRALPVPD